MRVGLLVFWRGRVAGLFLFPYSFVLPSLESSTVVVVTVTHTECVFPSVTEHRLGEHGVCVPQPIP